MTSSYTVELQGSQELFNRLNAAVKESVAIKSLTTSAKIIQAWVMRNRLTGPRPQFLGVRTNRLRSSITAAQAVRTGNEYIAKIGTNVTYAPIHEFGGTVSKISSKGKAFTAKYPKRAFLQPALEDSGNRQAVLNIMVKNIREALEKK